MEVVVFIDVVYIDVVCIDVVYIEGQRGINFAYT